MAPALDNDNDEQAFQGFSGISLPSRDTTRYRRFYLYHCLALLPTLLLLALGIVGSFQSRYLCDLRKMDPNRPSDYDGTCLIFLDSQIIISNLVLGSMTWLASYACRRASWFTSSSLIPAFFHQDDSTQDRVTVSVAILLQSFLSESLRILSFYYSGCTLFAAIHQSIDQDWFSVQADDELPKWAWRLSFRDPRFTMALWVSLAWSFTEFVFGTVQILHQVGLYHPTLCTDECSSIQGLFTAESPLQNSAVALERARDQLHRQRTTSQDRRLVGQIPTSYGSTHSDGDSVSSSSTETDTELELLLEDQVEQFLQTKERAEVENVLGVPLPSIPIALCMLWRIDALLWSVGSGLLLSACFAHGQGYVGHLSGTLLVVSDTFLLLPPISSYTTTFAILALLHATVSALWATSLPTIGFAAATYGSLLIGLLLLIAGLARWGLLV